MPKYDIQVLCPECGQFHELELGVQIDKIFEVYALKDAYRDGLLSPDIMRDLGRVFCPVMERHFDLPSPHQLILVAARHAA